MNRHIHHPSCPARYTAGASCVCPPPRPARRDQLVEALAFAAMLGAVVALPLYLIWTYGA